MTNIPYGFDANAEGILDDPWTKLATINEHMEACQPLPPHLARWLGRAIDNANGDADAFVRGLGLKKRGRPSSKWTLEQTHAIGRRICEAEDSGEAPERAIAIVLRECIEQYGVEPSRPSAQSWRDSYRAAWEEAHCR